MTCVSYTQRKGEMAMKPTHAGELGFLKGPRSTSIAIVCMCALFGWCLSIYQASASPSNSELHTTDLARINSLAKALEGISIGTLSYIDFSAGEDHMGHSYNRFRITRGYLTIRKQLTPWCGFRVTPDVTQETVTTYKLAEDKLVATEDANHADFKLRLKYLYAEFQPSNIAFLTDMKIEIGMGHIPWLDFEEHINPYRCQGTMFIERAGIFNSADLGIGVMGYIGGQLPKDYQDTVNKHYAGTYGSWHIGLYNGGGYHAKEANNNKIPEVRLTLRPLPYLLPGLQVSYFGLYGQGNKKAGSSYPLYNVHLAALSYEHQWVTFIGQYGYSRGNQKGTLVDGQGRALRSQGFSLFLDVQTPLLNRSLSLFGRYDHFDPDTKDWIASGDDSYDLAMGGMSIKFFSKCMAILVYEHISYDANNGGLGKVPVVNLRLRDESRIQTVVQIAF